MWTLMYIMAMESKKLSIAQIEWWLFLSINLAISSLALAILPLLDQRKESITLSMFLWNQELTTSVMWICSKQYEKNDLKQIRSWENWCRNTDQEKSSCNVELILSLGTDLVLSISHLKVKWSWYWMLGHGECVKFMRDFGIPMLVLGGGGYTIKNVSRCWTYETGLLLDKELDNTIPPNDYYEYYAPHYQLHLNVKKHWPFWVAEKWAESKHSRISWTSKSSLFGAY